MRKRNKDKAYYKKTSVNLGIIFSSQRPRKLPPAVMP